MLHSRMRLLSCECNSLSLASVMTFTGLQKYCITNVNTCRCISHPFLKHMGIVRQCCYRKAEKQFSFSSTINTIIQIFDPCFIGRAIDSSRETHGMVSPYSVGLSLRNAAIVGHTDPLLPDAAPGNLEPPRVQLLLFPSNKAIMGIEENACGKLKQYTLGDLGRACTIFLRMKTDLRLRCS